MRGGQPAMFHSELNEKVAVEEGVDMDMDMDVRA